MQAHPEPDTIVPLTSDRWPDFEALFGPRGACGGCWCMWWRLPRSEFNRLSGDGNRQLFHAIVAGGLTPGLLAYAGQQAVGWCALGPREQYPALDRSRILKRVDDRPVWSITCFFVARAHRRQGLTVLLLEAAKDWARSQGAEILEGYPKEMQAGSSPDPFVFTGLASAFRRAGFQEVLRRSETRPIMRVELHSNQEAA